MQRSVTLGAPLFVLIALLLAPLGACAAKKNPAIVPVPQAGKEAMHERFVEIARRGGVDVLLLGDSITDAWGGEGHLPRAGAKIYAREFEPLHSANFGIGGDRTQHVLWRLQNGELDGIKPKVVMLMIGTNNAAANTSAEIAAGIKAIVEEIHKRSPGTKVLLLGIFPRGQKPNRLRDTVLGANAIISKLDDGGKTVKYLDIGDRFLNRDGMISAQIMPDYLHLTEKGYELWADAVRQPLRELLGK
jgi:lysophospholipase L1-like esterase